MFSVKSLMNLLLNDAKNMSSGSIVEGNIHTVLCKFIISVVCSTVFLSAKNVCLFVFNKKKIFFKTKMILK